MNILLIIIYSALTMLCLTLFHRYKRANPVYWFLIFQWLMAAGTFWLIDLGNTADQVYVVAYFLSLLFFAGGALLYYSTHNINLSYKNFYAKDIEIDFVHKRVYLVLLIILSIVVTISYYKAVGSNIFLNLILGVTVDDFSTVRLAAYSGERYFAPGYTNQFKNVLLPVCVSIYGAWCLYQGKRVAFFILMLLAIPFLTLALLGTGQRAFFAYSFVAFLFGLSGLVTLRIKKLLLPGLFVLIIFSYTTYFYKSHQIDDGSDIITASLIKTMERFFITEQLGALGGFRYLYSQDVVYFSEWRQQLVGLLPGVKGSTLQHDLFYLVHGTDRGTEGISTVASVIYNGGLLSVPLYFFLIGYFYFAAYHRFLKGKRSIYRVFAYGALFFYMSIFVSGGPSTLINNGAITLILLLFIRKLSFNAVSKSRAATISMPRSPCHV